MAFRGADEVCVCDIHAISTFSYDPIATGDAGAVQGYPFVVDEIPHAVGVIVVGHARSLSVGGRRCIYRLQYRWRQCSE